MDFGLAKFIGSDQFTRTRTAMGTASYMSPEQAKGENADQRTDIWSFGIVLYEMLTGQLPFKSEYEQAVIYSLLNEKQIHASELNEAVPKSINKIINKCLEKNPSDRYQSAGNIIEALTKSAAQLKAPKRKAEDFISLAVLPFADISPEQNNKYFSDGLTEEIIIKLSKLKKVRIISRTSVMNFNRTGKTMKQIASELDARYVIEGSVRKNANALRIAIQLIDAYNDAYLWADNFDGTTHQIFDFQEEVASKILKTLKVKLTPEEKKRIKRRTTQNTEAYQFYLRGRFFWNKRTIEGYKKAVKYFEKAIKIDKNYALPWSGIADSYNLITENGIISRKEVYPKALAAVRRALELDHRLSEAHASLGLLLLLNEWDWKNSKKELKLSLKYNPNYATAHQWYGEWLLFNGIFEEAISEITKAESLEPLSAAILKDKGIFFYYSRNYDKAIEYGIKSSELDPNLAAAYRLLSLAYLGKKMFPEAAEENKKWKGHNANPMEVLVATSYCRAAEGRRKEALKILSEVLNDDKISGNIYRGIALVYSALEDKEHAIEWLHKAFEIKAESLFLLKIDPKLDPLRSDPRLDDLIAKVGLTI